jgi:hypothetical protein
MILFAQSVPPAVTGGWLWGFVGVAVGLGAILFCWNQGVKALDRFTGKPQVPQPMNVEIVKALHEQFADKGAFDKHVAHTTQRHAQIFAGLDRVEREARAAMDERFSDLAAERANTLEKLTTQLGYIRESIVEVKTELKIRNSK